MMGTTSRAEVSLVTQLGAGLKCFLLLGMNVLLLVWSIAYDRADIESGGEQ
jgi:hypothetical protein